MTLRDWHPHVTVAAVAECDGRFLMVEEYAGGEVPVLNQPAGHLEPAETLIDAVRREVLEETAYRFEPRFLVGVYQWSDPQTGLTYIRFTFGGETGAEPLNREPDPLIIRSVWLTPGELEAAAGRFRSPMVALSIRDFENGRRLPLNSVTIVGK